MSQWRPRLEYFSLTRLISAYSRRTFRIVPGQLEAFEGSWPPLLHVALAVAVAGCGWLWQALAVAGCGTGADHQAQCQSVPPGGNSARPFHRDRATGSEPPHVAKPVGA